MVKVLNIIKVLIGFHAFSRCDQTGKFHGYRKKSFQQTPLRSPDVLDTFGRLGNDEPPIKTNLTKFEKLVLKKKNKLILCTLTLVALKKKVSRAHYITIQQKSANINWPSLPDPNDYGWLFNGKDQVFEPVMTSLAPAPESIIHLTVCNCKTNTRLYNLSSGPHITHYFGSSC